MRPPPAPPNGRLALAAVVRTLPLPLALAVLLLGVAGCEVGEGAPGSIGESAPEYAAPTMDGDTVSLADLRGEAVLLNVWATWCPPCRIEMPHLQELHEELGERGLRVVGVSVDSRGAGGAVKRFTDELGVDFLILQDPGERVANAFGTYGVPANILIDPEGVVRWRHSGPVTADDPVLRELLEEVLPRSNGQPVAHRYPAASCNPAARGLGGATGIAEVADRLLTSLTRDADPPPLARLASAHLPAHLGAMLTRAPDVAPGRYRPALRTRPSAPPPSAHERGGTTVL